ncbi:LAFE_0G10440g1_1 [Lachancea fermentati]|uniref:Metacaspase-1 n=1 Tax=Lachancea fermentati TaxID=4955 RepID=A0A1G4MHV6_LACFM|nr:LAFE_0G10440g1_1 [Lachancea fermentati]
MFPGNGGQTYHNQQQANGFSRPGAPPPGYSGSSSQQYSRPAVPPPSGSSQSSYSRPAAPPAGPPPGYGGQGYARPPAGPPPGQSSQGSYSRPSAPPPSGRNDIQQNHNSGGNIQGPSGYQQPNMLAAPPQQTQYVDQTQNQVAYQYSQCTGRRKALLIGINYIGSQNELRGCINDAHNMFNFLTSRYGYRKEDIVILTDDQQQPAAIPTKANMLRAMQWLVNGAQPNDALFFHYSGHGGQTEDLDGDEEDGMDDVIYPVDFQSQGPIIDDDMHNIMVKQLPAGVRLTALFDSCHSGTVLDLPYTYSTKGVIKEPNLWKNVGQDGLQAAMAYVTGNGTDLASSLGSMFTTVTKRVGRGDVDRERIKQIKFSAADVIMFSGSKDNQTSADAVENGLATGAMSYAFVKVLSTQPQQSYLSMLQNMRYELSSKYTQKPQLSSSHPINVNLQFLM